MDKKSIVTFEEYVLTAPEESRVKLVDLRMRLKKLIPNGEEVISYGMPAFKWKGIVVWFAGYKKHIGFYPKSKAIEVLSDKLINFKTSKGAIQFPINRELPWDLIEEIVQIRLKENEMNELMKKTKKTKKADV